MKRVLVLLITLVLVCTGCGLDVESYLHPPRVGGQQQAVQAALETYLRDVGGNNLRYTLEYPLEGAHTAAFILCDEKGYPIRDTATAYTALAFYSLSSAPDITRMNRLQRSGDEWVSVADTVSDTMGITCSYWAATCSKAASARLWVQKEPQTAKPMVFGSKWIFLSGFSFLLRAGGYRSCRGYRHLR